MSARPVVMYLGGFARVGGIEAFARDFLLAIAPHYPARELVIWGGASGDHALLNEIVESGAEITRSPWRWGCRWNLPDFVLVPQGLAAILRAGAVIFKRPPPLGILRCLRRFSRLTGRRVPFILIMPYRAGEYWSHLSDSSQIDDFDVISVQTPDSIQEVKRLGYRGRIENIPLLPPEPFAPVDYPSANGNGTIRLGFLGRMVEQKNLGYLLEVYRALTRHAEPNARFELHLFGDGPLRAELEKTCAGFKLPDVTFHGEIAREETIAAIDSCDIFLNTSLTEGQCLVALEVLSRGRPFIATPVGALPEMLRRPELGRLAPLDDAATFAERIIEMVDSILDGKTSPLSVMRAFQLKYDYEAIVKQYLALLAAVGVQGDSA